jgi:hypothetical protein
MLTEYETFVRDPARILSGREVVLCLRDLSPGRKKYKGINVRGVVSRPPRAGEPVVWLRSVVGMKDPEPCSVHIIETLPSLFAARPYSDFFATMQSLERK